MIAFLIAPETWLIATNLALLAVVLLCLGGVGVGVFQEVHARRKEALKRNAAMAGLDREFRQLVDQYRKDDHTFDIDGLGILMADGGEKTQPPADEPRP